jgi:hypothetical protein
MDSDEESVAGAMLLSTTLLAGKSSLVEQWTMATIMNTRTVIAMQRLRILLA